MRMYKHTEVILGTPKHEVNQNTWDEETSMQKMTARMSIFARASL